MNHPPQDWSLADELNKVCEQGTESFKKLLRKVQVRRDASLIVRLLPVF